MTKRKKHEDIGFVLKTIPFSESDLIVHLLLKNHGKQAFFAPSARHSKRRFRGGFLFFSRIQVSFSHKNSDNLMYLHETKVVESKHSISQDLRRMAIGFYALELLQLILEKGQGSDLFEQVSRFLSWLNTENRSVTFLISGHLRFQLLLLYEIGFLFDLQKSTRGETSLRSIKKLAFVFNEGFFSLENRRPGERVIRIEQSTLKALQTIADGHFIQEEETALKAQSFFHTIWTEMINYELKSWKFLRETFHINP